MKKILIVEDDEKMKKLLSDAFAADGFKVFEASNGQEGFDMALDYLPDAIVTDLMMPIMDGLTMMKRLKEESLDREIPVTVLTNLGELDTISGALKNGAHRYIVKSDTTIDDIVKGIAKELK